MSNVFQNRNGEDTCNNSQIFLQSNLNLSEYPPIKEEYSSNSNIELKHQTECSLRGGDQRRSRLFQLSEQQQPEKLTGFIIEANEVVPTIELNDQEVQLKEVYIPLDNIQSNHEDEEYDVIPSNRFQGDKKSLNTPQIQNITSTTIAPARPINFDASPFSKRQQNNVRNSHHSLTCQTPHKASDRNLDKYNKSNYMYNSHNMDQKSSFSPINSVQKNRRASYDTNLSYFKVLFLVNRFLFQLKKILLFFHVERLNSFQLNLIGDLGAQSYEQDSFGVPYHFTSQQYEQSHQSQSMTSSSISQTRSANFSQYQSMTISPVLMQREHARQKRQKQMRKIYKKINKYLGIYYLMSAYVLLKQRMRRVAKLTIDKIPLIDPHSHFYYFWQIVILLCDIVVMIYIPFQASFISIEYIEEYFFRIVLPIIYCSNILINFNVSVYDKGVLITSRTKIIQLYLQDCFVYDAIAVLAAFTSYLLYLVRYLYANTLIDQIKSYFLLNSNFNAMIQLSSLVIKIFVFSHIFSCCWHAIGTYYYSQNRGWMHDFGYSNKDNMEMYIVCFYYAVVTMSTIGYGDIYAKTTGEMGFMIFAILISSCLFGYTLNAIGTIISDLRFKNENYSKKQAQLEEYLSRHSVDVGLRNRARKYIQYIYQQENMFKKDGQENLKLLNSYLKQEIQKDINKKAFSKAKSIFQSISNNQKFFENILSIIKEQSFGPEELIILPNSSQQPSIYIVQYGEVEMFLRSRDSLIPFKSIQVLKAGSVFGQQEFFTNNQINYLCARSVGLTYISYIPLTDFQILLNEFPEEREKFFNIRDTVLVNKQNHVIKDVCLSCKADNHNLQHCPYIFYDPIRSNSQNIVTLAQKFNKEEIDLIQDKIRTRKKYSTVKNMNYTHNKVLFFQENQSEAIQLLMIQYDDQDAIEGTQQGFESFVQMKEEAEEMDNLLPVLKQQYFSESRKRSLSNLSNKNNNSFRLIYPQQVSNSSDIDTLKIPQLSQQQQSFSGTSFQMKEKDPTPLKGQMKLNSGSSNPSSHKNNNSAIKKSNIGLLAEVDKNLSQSIMTFENRMKEIDESQEMISPLMINDTSKEESDQSNVGVKKLSSQSIQDYLKRSVTLRDPAKKESKKSKIRQKKRSFTNFNERLVQKDFVLEDMISKNKAILNTFTEQSNKNIIQMNTNMSTSIQNHTILNSNNNNSGNVSNSNNNNSNNNNNSSNLNFLHNLLNNQSTANDKRYHYLQYVPSTNHMMGNIGQNSQPLINVQPFQNHMYSSGSNYKNQSYYKQQYKTMTQHQNAMNQLYQQQKTLLQQNQQLHPNFVQQFSQLTLPTHNNKNNGDIYMLPEDIQTSIQKQIQNIIKYNDRFNPQGQNTLVSMQIDAQRNFTYYFVHNNLECVSVKHNEKLKGRLAGKRSPHKKPRRSKYLLTQMKDSLLVL